MEYLLKDFLFLVNFQLWNEDMTHRYLKLSDCYTVFSQTDVHQNETFFYDRLHRKSEYFWTILLWISKLARNKICMTDKESSDNV